jgi:hypothetical protein
VCIAGKQDVLCEATAIESAGTLLEYAFLTIHSEPVRNAQRQYAPASPQGHSRIGKDHVCGSLDSLIVPSADQVMNGIPSMRAPRLIVSPWSRRTENAPPIRAE